MANYCAKAKDYMRELGRLRGFKGGERRRLNRAGASIGQCAGELGIDLTCAMIHKRRPQRPSQFSARWISFSGAPLIVAERHFRERRRSLQTYDLTSASVVAVKRAPTRDSRGDR